MSLAALKVPGHCRGGGASTVHQTARSRALDSARTSRRLIVPPPEHQGAMPT